MILDPVDAEIARLDALVSGVTTYGVWTPTLTGSGGGSGQAYSLQKGVWARRGRVVHIWGRLALTAKGTITGAVLVTGLPVASVSDTDILAGASFGHFENFSGVAAIYGTLVVSQINLQYTAGSGTGSTGMLTAQITNTTAFSFSATYLTD